MAACATPDARNGNAASTPTPAAQRTTLRCPRFDIDMQLPPLEVWAAPPPHGARPPHPRQRIQPDRLACTASYIRIPRRKADSSSARHRCCNKNCSPVATALACSVLLARHHTSLQRGRGKKVARSDQAGADRLRPADRARFSRADRRCGGPVVPRTKAVHHWLKQDAPLRKHQERHRSYSIRMRFAFRAATKTTECVSPHPARTAAGSVRG